MMPAAKMLDPIVGVDVHIVQPPGTVPPVPVPHPHTGMLFDPFDLAPYIGATVKVGGLPRAVAGTGSKMMPEHTPIGGTFVKPPANDSEMFMGSASVTADGDPFSYMALPLLSCWDVGGPPVPRPPRSMLPSLVLPTTVVLAVPSGVTVGGAPTVSLTALAGRVGLGPLLALYNFAKTGNPLALIGLAGPALKGLKFLNKKLKITKRTKCGRGVKLFGGKLTLGGEPINLITGAQFFDVDDMVEPGGLFRFSRHYSTAKRDRLGPLGYGFTHAYEQTLELFPQAWRYRDNEDVEVDFEPLSAARRSTKSGGMTLRLVSGRTDVAELLRRGKPTLRFALPTTQRQGVAYLSSVHQGSRDLELRYDEQRLVGFIERDRSWPEAQRIVFSLEYDSQGLLVAVWRRADTGIEAVVRYGYDARQGLLMRSMDAERRMSGYEFDARRLMTRRQDPGGYEYTWAYDAKGRCVETSGRDGLWACRMEYHPQQRETHLLQDGARFVLRYDQNHRITERVLPDGGVETWEVDDQGRIVGEVDAGGRAMTWLYDDDGAHFQRVDRFGNRFPTEWEAPFTADPMAPAWPETPLQREVGPVPADEATLGGDPRLLQHLPAEAQGVARGLVRLRDPGHSVAAVAEHYDRLGRLIERRDAAGRVHRWNYGHSEHAIRHRDADGKVYERKTERWNLITAEIDPLGHTVGYAYSPREEVTCITDPLGNETHYDYDAQDRLIRIRRAGGVEEEHIHDPQDRLVEIRDAHGDALVELSYDHRCLVSGRTLADGHTHTLEHDRAGNPTVVSTDEHDVHIERDHLGRVLADRVDGLGIEHSRGGRRRTSMVLGRFPIGTRPLIDETGRDVGVVVVDPTGGTHTIRRDRGSLVLREHANGSRELSEYDDRGHCSVRIGTRITDDGQVRCDTIRYTRSTEGDVLQVEDSIRGTTRYEVDDAHRLVGEDGPRGRVDFVHDEAGNLRDKPGLGNVTLGADNQIVAANGETFTYDDRFHLATRDDGETTTRYHYDPLGMLVRVEDDGEEPWTAAYDAWGRRLACGRGEDQTRFYWDGERLAAELRSDGRLRVYVYASADAMQPVVFVDYDDLQDEPERGRVYAVFYDQVGQPLRIEDASGRTVWWAAYVDPYGEIEVADAEIDFALRWPGHYYDASVGLHYNRYRYYDPRLGRYLQSDPLGQAGGLNVYAYPSNPLLDVDVIGLTKHTGKGGGKAGSKGPTKGAKKPGTRPKAPDPADIQNNPKRYAEMRADEIRANQRKGSSETFHVQVVKGPDGKNKAVITSSTDHQKAPKPIGLKPGEEFRAPDPPRPMKKGADGRPTRSPEPHPKGSSKHHAEQRGARSLKEGEKVVAGAPTRGCCAGCKKAMNNTDTSGRPRPPSTDPPMSDTIPEHRRDKKDFNDYRRERKKETGSPWTYPEDGSS
ncbi:MAG: RHS repeat-associated core domain-containing protein [Myxococcota bacterium]